MPRNQPQGAPQPNLPEDVSPVVRAARWTSRILTISLEMVIPGLVGYWLDQKLGTKVLLMLIGFALGGIAAFGHLLHIAGKASSTGRRPKTQTHEAEKEDPL